jgi:hypothetical protein
MPIKIRIIPKSIQVLSAKSKTAIRSLNFGNIYEHISTKKTVSVSNTSPDPMEWIAVILDFVEK